MTDDWDVVGGGRINTDFLVRGPALPRPGEPVHVECGAVGCVVMQTTRVFTMKLMKAHEGLIFMIFELSFRDEAREDHRGSFFMSFMCSMVNYRIRDRAA